MSSQTILVLGASGAIGSRITRALSTPATDLVLHGNDPVTLTALAEEVLPRCTQVTTHKVDLSLATEIQTFGEKLRVTLPSLDWIINAAGYIDEKESEHTPSYEHLERAFLINTLAPIYLTQVLQERINPGGGVIMISSTASLWGNPGFPIYASTKGALNTFTQALSKQFENSGRSAIVLCPGGTNTPMRERIAADAQNQQSPEVISDQIKNIVSRKSEFHNGDIVIIRDKIARRYLSGTN